MKITTELLDKKQACGSARQRFTRLFGRQTNVTMRNVMRFAKFDVNGSWLDWAGQILLKGRQRQAYNVFRNRLSRQMDRHIPYISMYSHGHEARQAERKVKLAKAFALIFHAAANYKD